MALGPLATIVTAELTRGVMNSGLAVLDAPFAMLARAHAMVIHEKLLLITGHGFEALVRAMQTGLFPPIDAERADVRDLVRTGRGRRGASPRR